MQKLKLYAPSVLRYAMAIVILWFGSQQFINTANWLGYVPDSVVTMSHLSRETIVYLNGAAELILGVLLLFGIWTRWVALLLALHLLDIMFTVGYGEIAVRDFGLALATFVVFMNGSDMLCLHE
ncbi:MAG TPA: DoxX family membrane protein [Candidatus Paceibacterota bacterium]|nr:DoxX family membrane protein [Candidatus Paceibacterota bacterium]